MHQAYHPNMSHLTRWLNDPLADPVIMEEERAETQAVSASKNIELSYFPICLVAT